MGIPSIISADAALVYSAIARQSSQILVGHPEGDKSTRVRFEGTAAPCGGGTKAVLTHRAQVGNCPCCTSATHVAAPATYEVREFSNVKARGLELRETSGPRVARRLAAYLFLRMRGALVRRRGIGQRSPRIWRRRPFL